MQYYEGWNGYINIRQSRFQDKSMIKEGHYITPRVPPWNLKCSHKVKLQETKTNITERRNRLGHRVTHLLTALSVSDRIHKEKSSKSMEDSPTVNQLDQSDVYITLHLQQQDIRTFQEHVVHSPKWIMESPKISINMLFLLLFTH